MFNTETNQQQTNKHTTNFVFQQINYDYIMPSD